tara:strand:- start:28 stop:507 length:480 start_codon:yes stop_codon:yes gene_type:complete
MTFEFEVGKKYTTFEISDFMACTVKREIVIKDQDDRGTIFALKGKRKRFYTKCDKSMAVFEGHDLDIKADSDVKGVYENGTTFTSFSGNALLNFGGTVEDVKDWIENKQLNPELDKSLIVATTNPGKDGCEFMVYPEFYREGNHVVVDRIIKKQLEVVE